jgi:hypothetical protein
MELFKAKPAGHEIAQDISGAKGGQFAAVTAYVAPGEHATLRTMDAWPGLFAVPLYPLGYKPDDRRCRMVMPIRAAQKRPTKAWKVFYPHRSLHVRCISIVSTTPFE